MWLTLSMLMGGQLGLLGQLQAVSMGALGEAVKLARCEASHTAPRSTLSV